MNYSEADEINKEDLEAASEKFDSIKEVKTFEDYSFDINQNLVNYNTNRPMFAYKQLFLVMNKDLSAINKVLYPSELSIDYVKSECARLQHVQTKFKREQSKSIIAPMRVDRYGVESFHPELSSLHPDTKEGAIFKDANDIHIGIVKINDNTVEITAEGELITIRKDVFGLLQRINMYLFLGMSEAFKLKEQENETTISN